MPTPNETRESFIHDRVLQDLVVAHLYATTAIADNEEVFELSLSQPDASGLRTIIYKTMKMKEVELIVHS